MPRYPPLKPPPHQRPNWNSLNEGQKRYAEEQYALARVRRGEKFDTSSVTGVAGGEEGTHAAEVPPNVHQLSEAEDSEDEADQHSSSMSSPDSGHGSAVKDADGDTVMKECAAKRNLGQALTEAEEAACADGESDPKRQRTMEEGSQLPGTSGQTGSGSGSALGGVNQNRPISIPRGLKNIKQRMTFHKQFKCLSHGLAYKILTGEFGALMTTPLVNIPWEYAFWYISPAEWSSLQGMPGVRAKHCHVKVTQYNPRIAFQTGDTTSTIATYNQNKFTLVAKGLRENDALFGLDHIYTYDTVEPMKPATATPVTPEYRGLLTKTLYGYDNDDPNFLDVTPVYTSGGEFALEAYYTMVANTADKTGWQPLQSYITEYNSMDCLGKVILEESYRFNNAFITRRVPAVANPGSDVSHKNMLGTYRKSYEFLTENTRGADPPIEKEGNWSNRFVNMVGSTTNNADVYNTNVRYYRTPLEQSPNIGDMTASNHGPACQPSLHIGLRPVPKLTSTPADQNVNSWADAQMYWIIDTSITLEADWPHVFNLQPAGLPRLAEVVHGGVTGDVFQPFVWVYDDKFNFGHPSMLAL